MIHFAHDSRVSGNGTHDSSLMPWERLSAVPELGTSDRVEPAAELTDAYRRLASHLEGAGRVADLGARSSAGLGLLQAAGLQAAPGATPRDLGACDVIVMVDTLGRLTDDAAALRALAENVAVGTRLVGAVAAAEVGAAPRAGRLVTFSPESIDALLVCSGWTAPTLVGRAGGMLLFETTRAGSLDGARALAASESCDDRAEALRLLAAAAQSSREPSLVRELMLAIARLQLEAEEIDAAEHALTTANAIAPGCARPFVGLAGVAAARGAVDDAEALLDHALSLDPACVSAWRALAATFRAAGDHARARECYECAASVAPGSADLALEHARALGDADDTAGALAVLDAAIDLGAAGPALQSTYCWLVAASVRAQGADRSGSFPIFGRARPDALAS